MVRIRDGEQVKVRPVERIHAAYPRLENGQIPASRRALPVCYAHDFKDGRSTCEPKTYDRERITCNKCRKVLEKFEQLPKVLDLALAFERELS